MTTSLMARRAATLDRARALRQARVERPGLADDRPSFLASALTERNLLMPTGEFPAWFAERRAAYPFSVTPVPLGQLDSWGFEPGSGNLVHTSGRFFSIEGIHVRTSYGPIREWSQPIICQPEIGLLGILVKEFDGVLHFLMQAKMEPGNINLVQLAPTVQATRSNYMRVHQGARTRYLDYFMDRSRGRVLVDVLQSEQGARFFRKRNRNIIVQVIEDVPPHDDFCWLTLAQIHALMRTDNLVNMDARTVLSCVPFAAEPQPLYRRAAGIALALPAADSFRTALIASALEASGTAHSDSELLSWFTELKTRYELSVQRIPLDQVLRWRRGRQRIFHDDRRFFTVIGVSVQADSREVLRWSQPLIKPRQEGIVTFLTKRINGVLHFLLQAKLEPGNFDILEMAPTVQCVTGSYRHVPPEERPPFLEYVLHAPPERIRFSAFQSEEGGRFYQEQNRNMIIEVEDSFPTSEPDNYIWVTLRQIKELIKYNNYLNVEARGLIACLGFLDIE
jgi:dTDP-4-dehydro-6-deoxy-alpha-D-glucopyranose 2,3-dehydratase